jgi:hypothetical protein
VRAHLEPHLGSKSVSNITTLDLGGLEDEPLWRREAQLHPPGGGARRAPRGRV